MMIDDTALALAFLVSLGAFTGFLSGMLGIGGGIVVVPALIVGLPVLGVEAADMTKIAVGSSLAIVVPTALASAQAHAGKNSIDWHVLVLLTPSFMAGAFVIAAFMGGLNTNLIILVFILFAFYSAVRMLRGWRRPAMPLRRPGLVELTVKGVLGGALSSLLGLGVGMVGVSLMERFVSLQWAIGTASAIAVPMALSGTAAYLVAPQACPTCIGFVYPPAVAAIGISAVLAAPLGAWAAHALPVHALKKIFALFLIIAAVSLAYKTFTREVIAAETARFAALGKRLVASQVTAARAAEVPLWIGNEPAQVPQVVGVCVNRIGTRATPDCLVLFRAKAMPYLFLSNEKISPAPA